MKRIPVFIALLAVLALPAIALAERGATASASEASLSPTTMSAYQMGAGVSIVDFAFSPSYVAVSAGSTVSWYNAGAAPHTVSSDWGAFDSGTLGSGGGYSMTFWTPGYYSYHCAIHPGMTGAVQVN